MTTDSVSHPTDGPPRHFWRRALSLILDLLLFHLAAYAVLTLITVVSPWNIGFGVLEYTDCRIASSSPLLDKVNREWPLEAGLERSSLLCRKMRLFDETYYLVNSRTTKTTGLYTWSKWVTIASDENGAPLEPAKMRSLLLRQSFIQPLPFAAALAMFIYFTSGGRRTPGKRLMKLKVMTPYGVSPGLHRAAKRELLKFAPLVLGAVANLMIALPAVFSPDIVGDLITQVKDMNATNLPLLIVLPIAAGIGQVLWWFVPLLFWRGQTYYDRIVGCVVVRSDQPSSISERHVQ